MIFRDKEAAVRSNCLTTFFRVRIQARSLDQNLATKADIAAIQVDLVAMKFELIKWVFGINLTIATSLMAAIKFL